mmetsp:Transcript_82985/g.238506  ORF Transcript_82985/g.238506 Transcript_82985/m.238506 type:complete len:230 (+) Transcript_82985:1080-1769(+)
MTSIWPERYCTASMRHCRAFVIDVFPVGTSDAHHRNLCSWLPVICQTVRAMPRISPKCFALRSPQSTTGASETLCSAVNSVSASTICVTWRTRTAVCERSSGSFARCVETTTNGGAEVYRHCSSTIKQLLSRWRRPLSSLPSTKSMACCAKRLNFERRQKTPQPSREAARGRLWKTMSHSSSRHWWKYSFSSSSTSESTSASSCRIWSTSRTFREGHLKSSSRRFTSRI